MSENSSYAVIRHGGKQFKVSPGVKLKVDKINAKAGEEFTFSDVVGVFKDNQLQDAGKSSVKAKIIGDVKDKKVIIFKKKRRKGYTKKQGHRQVRTEILVEAI